MQKLYTILLSAVMATATAFAAPATPQLQGASFPKAKVSATNGTTLMKKTQPASEKLHLLTSDVPAKAPAKIAAQVADVVGDYEISYILEFSEGGGPYAGEMAVTAGTAENTVVFNFPFVNGTSTLTLKLTGTLDPATGVINILADQPSGFNGATVEFKHWATNAWQTITEINATYTGTAITFDADDLIGLAAAGGGYYTFFDMITMDKIIDDPNADPNEGWTSVGQATFIDPWVLTAFSNMNQYENSWKVELQQNDADKNVYRLVDPYKGNCPVASYNTSTAKHGYIQFNVADPDHVWFEGVDAGFANATLGVTKFYCLNTLGLYYEILGKEYAPSLIVQVYGDEMISTTFRDGVIVLGSRDATDKDGNPYIEYDANFGIQGDIAGGYGWQDQAGNSANMTGLIIFPDATFPVAPVVAGEGLTDGVIDLSKSTTVTLTAQDGASIYYSFKADNATTEPQAAAEGEDADGDDADDTDTSIEKDGVKYQLYTEPIALTEAGTLSYFARYYTLDSEVETVTVVSTTTAIESIKAAGAEAVEYYNLQGIKVANPEGGVFIRKQGSKATKIRL